jgi:two-component system chemotaxis response regulator CheY
VKSISAHSLYARIKKIIEKPREFVKTKSYFGPDRRRQQVEFNGKERRKLVEGASSSDEPREVSAEEAVLSQD